MDVLVLLARLVLAGVFVVSGIGKLLDLEGSIKATKDFGVPEAFSKPAGLALPLFELFVALLLVGAATATVGGFLALVLLGAFIGGISYNMSRGNSFDCHCFGQIHSEPIGWKTLARNAGLSVLALLVLFGGLAGRPGPSLVAWMGDMSALGWLATVIAVVALATLAGVVWLLVHLLGQNGRLLVRLDKIEEALAEHDIYVEEDDDEDDEDEDEDEEEEGLPFGTVAPAFSLTNLQNEATTLDALRAKSKPVLLVFSDPGCGPCNALMPDIGKWQRDHADKLTVAVVSRGGADANRAKAEEHALQNVLLQDDSEVSDLYQSYGTPTGILVRADGTIGSAAALGGEQIRTLVKQVLEDRVPVPAPAPKPAPAPAARPTPGADKIGKPAPEFALADLDGETVSLEQFKGSDAVVLFWNPGCGFCQRMLPDLKAWEEARGADDPRLLVVSTGDAESNRAQGIASPVLLDAGFSTGRAFGASGTPSAVRIDAEGNVASAIGVGAPSVLGLLRGELPDVRPTAVPEPAEPSVPKIGTKAPALKLPNLDGQTVDLADHLGTRTLVLFWNPGCGFCQRMLDELKAWEAKPPKGAPKLMVVSTGTAEANRAQGLRSPVLLDQSFSVGSAFGADGTPSAILVDAQGNIGSKLGVGAKEVMDLARSKA